MANYYFEDDISDSVNFKRWKDYIIDNKINFKNMPIHDKRFRVYSEKFKKTHQKN